MPPCARSHQFSFWTLYVCLSNTRMLHATSPHTRHWSGVYSSFIASDDDYEYVCLVRVWPNGWICMGWLMAQRDTPCGQLLLVLVRVRACIRRKSNINGKNAWENNFCTRRAHTERHQQRRAYTVQCVRRTCHEGASAQYAAALSALDVRPEVNSSLLFDEIYVCIRNFSHYTESIEWASRVDFFSSPLTKCVCVCVGCWLCLTWSPNCCLLLDAERTNTLKMTVTFNYSLSHRPEFPFNVGASGRTPYGVMPTSR